MIQSPWEGWMGGLFRSLGRPPFRSYFFGQGLSLLGTWMQYAALGWLAFSFMEQSKWPAWVQAAQLLPSVVLGPLAGRLIDRVSKRSLILVTQLGLAILALLLALAAHWQWLDPFTLVLWASVSGLVMAIDLPARLSYLADLVGREHLSNAVALNSFAFNLARAVGPSLAAAMFWILSVKACFVLNAMSYLGLMFALWGNGVPGNPPIPEESSKERQPRIPGKLIGVIVLAGFVAGFGWPIVALSPGYAAQILFLGPAAYSMVVGGIGLGGLMACILVAAEKSAKGREFRIGASMVCAALGLLIMGFFHQLVWALLGACLVGLGMVGFMATTQTVIQIGAPPSLRGRILGIWTATLSGALPLGNFVAGPLADHWGVDWVLKVMGTGIICAWATWLILGYYRSKRTGVSLDS